MPSFVDVGVKFVRDLRAKGKPERGKPVDKAFRDSLYESRLMFIDASALTALLTDEDDARELLARLQQSEAADDLAARSHGKRRSPSRRVLDLTTQARPGKRWTTTSP